MNLNEIKGVFGRQTPSINPEPSGNSKHVIVAIVIVGLALYGIYRYNQVQKDMSKGKE